MVVLGDKKLKKLDVSLLIQKKKKKDERQNLFKNLTQVQLLLFFII